ncbi:hypothetical protein TNCV_912991 [Trichonephila clavipes]|nr:hypothetical protein TNCV_912991 [Trichonephila clavipes]
MGCFKGMKTSPNNSRSYSSCRNCPQTHFSPDYIFDFKAILASLFKLILYSTLAPDLALLVIGVFGQIALNPQTRRQQEVEDIVHMSFRENESTPLSKIRITNAEHLLIFHKQLIKNLLTERA